MQYQRDKTLVAKYLRSLADRARLATFLGRFDDACGFHSEIVRAYQGVYARNPAKCFPQLVAHRRDYINCLTASARHHEASAQEATIVEMAQELYDCDTCHHDILAECLNSYADHLASVGQAEEANNQRLKLVSLERTLYRTSAQEYQPAYFAALRKYIHALDEAGRPEDACGAAHEIVTLYRDACVRSPDVHRSDAMASIEAYVERLTAHSLGREAEICSLLEELGQHTCALFDHNLWQGEPSDERLHRLAIKVDALHQMFKTAGLASKASNILVDVYRQLYAKNPAGTNARRLCNSLAACAHDLDAEGRFEEAAETALGVAAIIRLHPVPAGSSECHVRAEQLFYCAQHVAYARRYIEASDIAREAVKSANEVNPNNAELSEWAQRWVPKIAHRHGDIQKVALLKNPRSQLREAKTLGLTYQRDKEQDNDHRGRRLFHWISIVAHALIPLITRGIVVRSSPQRSELLV